MIWLVSLVELRVCFSWGSGFGEVSSWVNRSSQAESQLKQKPCLADWAKQGWGKTNPSGWLDQTELNPAGSGQASQDRPGRPGRREGVAKRGRG